MLRLFSQMAFDRLFDKTGILMGRQLWKSSCLGKRAQWQAGCNTAAGIAFVDDKCYCTAVCPTQRCTAVLCWERSVSLQCYFSWLCCRISQLLVLSQQRVLLSFRGEIVNSGCRRSPLSQTQLQHCQKCGQKCDFFNYTGLIALK